MRHVFTLAATAAAVLLAPAAQAQLANGNFATNGGAGQLTVNTTLANW